MEGMLTNKQEEVLNTEDRAVLYQFGLSEQNLTFDENPDGGIFFNAIRVEGETVLIWAVKEGSHFSPISHKHGHTLLIKYGSGIININGKDIKYKEGDSFDIAGSIPHGFVQVDSMTVVFEKRLKD